MENSITIRKIREHELADLLSLYRHLHVDEPELAISADVERLWLEICHDPQLHYLAADVGGKIVSSCTLAIIRNLTRGARPYGLIENVVTHPDFRKRGFGTGVLRAAMKIAWDAGCYKVMLLTGRKDPATLRFYEQAGFESGVKTGFAFGFTHTLSCAVRPTLCPQNRDRLIPGAIFCRPAGASNGCRRDDGSSQD